MIVTLITRSNIQKLCKSMNNPLCHTKDQSKRRGARKDLKFRHFLRMRLMFHWWCQCVVTILNFDKSLTNLPISVLFLLHACLKMTKITIFDENDYFTWDFNNENHLVPLLFLNMWKMDVFTYIFVNINVVIGEYNF